MDERTALKRRGLMAAAAAMVAGIVATKTSGPVEAGADGDLVMNTSTLAVGTTGIFTDNTFNQINAPFGAFRSNASGTTTVSLDGITGISSPGSQAKGVQGIATTSGYGVYGDGTAAGAYGVTGVSTTAYGVLGQSTSGVGAQGQILSASNAPNTIAVQGVNQSTGNGGVGVYGASTGGYGVLGTSAKVGFAGITGITSTANVPAFAGGSTVGTALAARFNGGVYVDCTSAAGGQFVVNPMSAKSGLLAHPDGSHRLMYSVEAPESWAEDVGTGTLVNGKAEVKLDPDFAAVIEPGDYHVFLTAYGNTNGLHVTQRSATGFTVAEHNAGTNSLTFSWRVMATPKTGKKAQRMAKYDLPAPLHLPTTDELAKMVTPPKKP